MIRLTEQAFDPGAELTAFAKGRAEVGAVAACGPCAQACGHGEPGGAWTRVCGCCTVFVDAKPVSGCLYLAAFADGASIETVEFAEAARARFDLIDLAIVHRIGKIAPGRPVVFVATAARHRRAAFEACDYLMDYLKSRAPFWKKEHGPDGARWIEPRDQDHHDLARWEKET